MSKLGERLLAEDADLRQAHEENSSKRELALSLRALRKRAGLTQQEVASLSGLTQSRISKMESPAGGPPTIDNLNRYADACGADLCIAFPTKDSAAVGPETVCAVL